MKQEILDALRGAESCPQEMERNGQETEHAADGSAEKSLHNSDPVLQETADPADGGGFPSVAAAGGADSSPGEGDAIGAQIRANWERLRSEAAALPGFALEEALRDPAFVRLTAPGVGVPVADAWYALHREEGEQRSAEESRRLLARAAAASARRPREGGGSGGAALIASDYRSMPRQEQLRVKQRIFEAAARGEKVYP